MNPKAIKSIDGYEEFLRNTLDGWSPQQRLAFAAAMAERWLPVYEAFSVQEQWGDADSLRRMMDAVWNHVQKSTLTTADLARYKTQLQDSTPHMDDFDAEEALAACMVLSDALECCATPHNTEAAVRAALSGFEAAVPNWVFEPEEQPRIWRQVAARKELRKQLKLVELIESTTTFDESTIAQLRSQMKTRSFIGEVSPRTAEFEPAGLTNQEAFEQYRRLLESQLKQALWEPADENPLIQAMMLFSPWAIRYGLRRKTIDGEHGKLADQIAANLLIECQKAKDASVKVLPNWPPDLLEMIELSVLHSAGQYPPLQEPHPYGPSLRYLWTQAKHSGKTDAEAWQHILDWALHRPTVWEREDQRKKKGKANSASTLGKYLSQTLIWNRCDNLDYPWCAEVNGVVWQVRLNDFPDDMMYSLLIDGEVAGSFHDWPETWQRT